MQENSTIALTEFAHGAGCGCKIAPAVLQEILGNQFALPGSKLLVGNETGDDAAVYYLNEETALISTTDFFTPIVDDPFDFGRVAAANAISDVYAMGGKPLMALAVLGWPVESLPVSLAAKVLEGARSICAEAGIVLAGGHSIDTKEPLFGLAVTGSIHPGKIKRNHTVQEGDVLLLTKPLGTGILSTAQKRKILKDEHTNEWMQYLTQLNSVGALLGQQDGVHAITDVTGFGLLGHLHEMVRNSGFSAELFYNRLPILPAAVEYAAQRIIPDAPYRNWNAYNKDVGFGPGVAVMEAFNILPDPQTNGGLLVALHPEALPSVQTILTEAGLSSFTQPVGRITELKDKLIVVVSSQ